MGVCLLEVGKMTEHKITDSILGPAFLSISMLCNSKIFPNIMQIKVVSIYVVHHLRFACGKIIKN